MNSSTLLRHARYAFGVVAASSTAPVFQPTTKCEQAPAPITDAKAETPSNGDNSASTDSSTPSTLPGLQTDATGQFHGLFPNRQLWVPKLPYPLWDKNWDNLHPQSTGNVEEDRKHLRKLRKEGVTRHILLIRHGQYDETHNVRNVIFAIAEGMQSLNSHPVIHCNGETYMIL